MLKYWPITIFLSNAKLRYLKGKQYLGRIYSMLRLKVYNNLKRQTLGSGKI